MHACVRVCVCVCVCVCVKTSWSGSIHSGIWIIWTVWHTNFCIY